jgi:hypothetical protein
VLGAAVVLVSRFLLVRREPRCSQYHPPVAEFRRFDEIRRDLAVLVLNQSILLISAPGSTRAEEFGRVG